MNDGIVLVVTSSPPFLSWYSKYRLALCAGTLWESMCMRERGEREREKEKEGERENEREREGGRES